MAKDKWFETVSIAQERRQEAAAASPSYSALCSAGQREAGLTVSDNVERVRRARLRPGHVVGAQAAKRDLSTNVMGQDISMPVIISPTGVQAVHPDGEVAVARAAASPRPRHGPVSSFRQQADRGGRGRPTSKTFFQMYWLGRPRRRSSSA